MPMFDPSVIKSLHKPDFNSTKMDNGQITIIGGSKLFHGAPLLALKAASRVCDMVYFSSPDPNIGKVANEVKSELFSFIWVPWEETKKYIEKSDAVLIGPGFMRYSSEPEKVRYNINRADGSYVESREITRDFLTAYPNKRWVIDAGSLQVMETGWIPKGAILTPNQKEYAMLFKDLNPQSAAKKYKCTIVIKGPITTVYTPSETIEIEGGNPGLTKGGTGDVVSGLTVALLAKNDAKSAATVAAFTVKKAAEKLAETTGLFYNSDDLSSKVFEVLNGYLS